tara:strand:+ start:241 stop:447 length:207 start_codon:yes stop_codon:yes gene_type:complete
MKKLYRNKTDCKIAGICSGIGDYFKIDPVIIRLVFIFGLFLGGGLIVYIIGWIIIPINVAPYEETIIK